ncbi:hypothetical protein B484DRAFT_38643 [Ochromonadaceae sp. CCMP2298]|nr:hypothetical protein B484DRAFT_38643 [Ochromonadaceae sp. CCMP2298]
MSVASARGGVSRSDFQKILHVWRGSCARARDPLQLPAEACAAFKTRINSLATAETRSTLDLSHCGLDDSLAKLLIEVLAMRPIIPRLDLSGNSLTNETVKLLLRLLKGQTNLVRKIDLDDRLSTAFLGEVRLHTSHTPTSPTSTSGTSVDAALLADVAMVSSEV